jgi:UDP-N-acetylmuramoylalanine-D-glutamate ligase
MDIGKEGSIAILGIGREGQVAWRYLREQYPEKNLTLIAEEPADPGFSEQLTENDSLVIGPLSDAGLGSFDVLVRSPGISLYRKSMQQAIKALRRHYWPTCCVPAVSGFASREI